MIDRILEDREKRFDRIIELIQEGKPVLCGKLNYPGEIKNTPEANKGFLILYNLLFEKFSDYIKTKEIIKGYDGNAVLMTLDMEPVSAKEYSIDIEDGHPLGRIFDIDVYLKEGTPISRSDIGRKPRTCIICGKNAKECTRSMAHDIMEVRNKINNMINIYMTH